MGPFLKLQLLIPGRGQSIGLRRDKAGRPVSLLLLARPLDASCLVVVYLRELGMMD